MSDLLPEPEMVLFCPTCGGAMLAPAEIRTLAEALAAEIVFGVANGTIKAAELGKRRGGNLSAQDSHLRHPAKPPLPQIDDGK